MSTFAALIPVIKEAPSDWNVVAFRRVASLRENRNGANKASALALSSAAGDLQPRDQDSRQQPAESYLERYWVVNPGDLVVNPMWLIGGSVGVSQVPGSVSPDYRVYRLAHVLYPRFIHYLLRSQVYIEQYRLLTRAETTFDRRITKQDFHDLPVLIPPKEKQQAIAGFLDTEAARIDALIAKKRRLTRVIHERSFARVYAAIRGEEEGGERHEDSRLEWLGSIPVTWPVTSVSAQFEVMLGKMLDQDRVTGDHLRPYLRNTNVQWDRIDVDDLLLMDFPPSERRRFEVLPGDLLVCEGGEPGRAAIWDGNIAEIYYQKALHRVRPRGHSTARWLFYCLRAATALNVFAVEGNTTTIAHLTGEQLKAYRFPFPERAVQERLVAGLDDDAAQSYRLLALIRAQIERLIERRQALITAAVTGELDIAAKGAG